MLTHEQQRDVVNLAEAFLKVLGWANPEVTALPVAAAVPASPSEWLTVAEFASRFGIGRTTVYESVRTGELKDHSTRIGHKIFVRANALDMLVAKD